jgi:hypothetical protein
MILVCKSKLGENMKLRYFPQWLSILPLMVLSAGLLHGQSTDVLTWRNNTLRDGLNNTETTLTQAAVTKTTFGKICSTAPGSIDGQVYAQPLVVTGGIPGYNHAVYIETMNDSVYFINGDSSTCAVIAQFSLLQAGEEAVHCKDVGGGQCWTFNPIIGIVGTPVIDTTTNTIYLVTWSELTTGACATTKSLACFVHRLHALNIATGAEKFNGPVVIPSVTIGVSTFVSKRHIQRPGLLLLPKIESNGDSALYLAFSEMDGGGVAGVSIPNGWIFRFDSQNLSTAPLAWTTTPNGEGGGVWMSGAGLAAAVDQAGGNTHIYISTGDGTFDAEDGGSDYGDSFVKLTPNLTVAASFTPFNQYCDDIGDNDLGSGGIMLIPNGIGSSTIDFAVATGKDGNIYVLDRADPGGYDGPNLNTCPVSSGSDLNYETVPVSTNEFYSTAAFWDQNLYSVANNTPLLKYEISATACVPGPVCTTPTASSSVPFGFGTVPVVSSNADNSGTGLVWAVRGNGWPNQNPGVLPVPAVLYAYDAQHVTQPSTLPMLWNNNQCPTRDAAGNSTKFVVPTVANGRVFVGTMDPTDSTNTMGRLDVYGPTTATCK